MLTTIRFAVPTHKLWMTKAQREARGAYPGRNVLVLVANGAALVVAFIAMPPADRVEGMNARDELLLVNIAAPDAPPVVIPLDAFAGATEDGAEETEEGEGF